MEQFIFETGDRGEEGKGDRAIVIKGDENFHLARVLRVKVGDRIFATDGKGTTYLCALRQIGKDKSVCDVIEEYHNLNCSLREFCIGISLLKPMSKLELAIEKCTELGARKFVLFNSERTEKVNPRPGRLQSIVKSAVKQSLQSQFPDLIIVKDLEAVLHNSSAYSEKFVLHEKSNEKISDYISHVPTDSPAVALIGPEGGFSDREIDFLAGSGFKTLSLGLSRLRSETAAIKMASLLAAY